MRKGALQLGINTIVILILAIAVLGVGIYFITEVLAKAIDIPPPPTDAIEKWIQSDELLAIYGLSEGVLTIPRGEKTVVHLSVLNNLEQPLPYEIIIEQKADNDETNNDLELEALYVTTAVGEAQGPVSINERENTGFWLEAGDKRGSVFYNIKVMNLGEDQVKGGDDDSVYDQRTITVVVK